MVWAKPADLREHLGVVTEDVNPAYSSQECSSCDFVSRSNRASQAYGRRGDALRRSAFVRDNLLSVDQVGNVYLCQ